MPTVTEPMNDADDKLIYSDMVKTTAATQRAGDYVRIGYLYVSSLDRYAPYPYTYDPYARVVRIGLMSAEERTSSTAAVRRPCWLFES